MSTLGKAVIEFSAETAKFTGDVGRAAAMFDKNMASMVGMLGSLRTAFLGAAGPAVLGHFVNQAIDAGDQLVKLSQKSGFTVEALGELQHGAMLADVDLQQLNVGLKEFNKSIVEAADPASKAAQIFKALGVDTTRGPQEALRQFADAIKGIKDPSQRSTAAVELMGKAGAEMIPWLIQGSEGMDKAAEQARKLGLIMSEETAKAAERLNDNLKILATTGKALGIALTEHGVGGLVALTNNLVEAKEKSNLLGQSLLEIAKFAAIAAAAFPKWTEIGAGGDKLAEFLFTEEERRRAMRDGPSRKQMLADAKANFGKTPLHATWTGAAEFGGPGDSNQEQLACALSGGKWENGVCVRGAAKSDTRAEELMQARLAAARNEERIQNEQNAAVARRMAKDEADATASVTAALLAREEVLNNTVITYDKLGERIEMTRDEFYALTEAEKRAKEMASDLGFTFTSAFEDAIVSGAKLRDVLKGLQQDILRVLIRKNVTEPGAAALSNLFSGLFTGGASAGMASAPVLGGPAYAEGTPYVPSDGYAYLHKGEAVVPAAMNNGGGGEVHVHLTVQSLDPRTSASVFLENESLITGLMRRAYTRNGRVAAF